MLSTTQAGRQFRADIKQEKFFYYPSQNEYLDKRQPVAYGHTTHDHIYRRTADETQFLDVNTQRFVHAMELVEPGEAPDMERKFTLDILAPGITDEMLREIFDEHHARAAATTEEDKAHAAFRETQEYKDAVVARQKLFDDKMKETEQSNCIVQ